MAFTRAGYSPGIARHSRPADGHARKGGCCPCEYRALQNQTKDLQYLLGKKTMEGKFSKKCFCNGPLFVKSLSTKISSPGSCFCPWSTRRPPHHAIRSEPAGQSRRRDCLGITALLTTLPGSRPGDGTSLRRNYNCFVSMLLFTPQRLLCPNETRSHPPIDDEGQSQACGQARLWRVSCHAALPHRLPIASVPRTGWRGSA